MNNYFDGKGTIGFTCDSCGMELQGITYVNGMKFCAKCYQEIFGETNKDYRIAQLQANQNAKAVEALEKVKTELDLIPTFKSENATGIYINLLTVLSKVDQLIKEYGGKNE